MILILKNQSGSGEAFVCDFDQHNIRILLPVHGVWIRVGGGMFYAKKRGGGWSRQNINDLSIGNPRKDINGSQEKINKQSLEYDGGVIFCKK